MAILNRISIFICVFLLFLQMPRAQSLYTPRASPRATVSQYIGVCKVSVDYSRPKVQGRQIFGQLVPFAKIWRAGANEATVLTLSHEVDFGGKVLTAGKYGLFIIPNEHTWTIKVNDDWDQWGAYHYDTVHDIVSINVPSYEVTHTESLTYSFTDISKEEANLVLSWSDIQISVPIKTSTHIQTLSDISRAVNSSRQGWYIYSAAAQYHFYERKEATQALKYIDIAIALEAPNPAPWMLKSQILASMEEYQDAILIAEKAIQVCKLQNYSFEIEENEANIKAWKMN